MDGYKIPADAQSLLLCLPCPPFLRGRYSINVICFGDFEQAYYDLKPQYKGFEIFSLGEKQNYRGVVDLVHEWKVE